VGGSWVFSADENARNDRHDALYVRKDIVVPEPEHAIAARLQKFASSCIGDHPPARGVALAVNLDDESVCVTAKVHKIASDRSLTTEMAAGKLRFAQMPP